MGGSMTDELSAENDSSTVTGLQELQVHPLAEYIPEMPEERLAELAASIKDRNLDEAIVLFEGKILDGRSRYAGCRRAGVPPRFVQFEGDDPADFVYRRSLRRDLSPDQRVAIEAEFKPIIKEETERNRRRKQAETQANQVEARRERCPDPVQLNSTGQGQGNENVTRKRQAERAGVSMDMIRRADAVKAADSSVLKEVAQGKTTLRQAEEKVGLREPKGPRKPRTRKPRVQATLEPYLAPGQVMHIPQPRDYPSDHLFARTYRLVGGFPIREVGLSLAEEIAASPETFQREMAQMLIKHLDAAGKVRTDLLKALRGHLERDTSGSRNGSIDTE
jgi:hypothetical protein